MINKARHYADLESFIESVGGDEEDKSEANERSLT